MKNVLLILSSLFLSISVFTSCSEECKQERKACMDGCPTEAEHSECMSACGPIPLHNATPEERDAYDKCISKCKIPKKCKDACNTKFLECEREN